MGPWPAIGDLLGGPIWIRESLQGSKKVPQTLRNFGIGMDTTDNAAEHTWSVVLLEDRATESASNYDMPSRQL